jgi:hypothetical protein
MHLNRRQFLGLTAGAGALPILQGVRSIPGRSSAGKDRPRVALEEPSRRCTGAQTGWPQFARAD